MYPVADDGSQPKELTDLQKAADKAQSELAERNFVWQQENLVNDFRRQMKTFAFNAAHQSSPAKGVEGKIVDAEMIFQWLMKEVPVDFWHPDEDQAP